MIPDFPPPLDPPLTPHLSRCEVCDQHRAVGVAAVPGLPLSVAYCAGCLQANAHPWGALVFNTAAIGGLQNAAEWWVEMVAATCLRLNRTSEEFSAEVTEVIAQYGEPEFVVLIDTDQSEEWSTLLPDLFQTGEQN